MAYETVLKLHVTGLVFESLLTDYLITNASALGNSPKTMAQIVLDVWVSVFASVKLCITKVLLPG